MSVSPKVKTFYFSRHKSENEEKKTIIKKAIQEEKPITIRSRASYDVRFQYKPADETCDEPRGWYSEEYKGCGNGHYYIALNGTHALFMEDD